MAIKVTMIPISVDPSRLVPNGNVAITFFVEACPDGWSEYTALRGRYPVGNPSGGDILGTVGTAMSNEEDRAVGQHNHTGTFSGSALATHTHSFSGTGLGTHNHTQSAHNHPFNARNGNATGVNYSSSTVIASYVTGGAHNMVYGGGPNITLADAAISDTTPTNVAITAGTPAGSNAAITGGTPAGSLSIANSGSVANSNAPYIQLVPCTKD